VSLCENELILSDEELICGPEPTVRTIIRQGILLRTSALTLSYSSKFFWLFISSEGFSSLKNHVLRGKYCLSSQGVTALYR
jgi:hypothetical protein